MDAPLCSDPLTQFCHNFLSEHRNAWPPDENELAKAFVGLCKLNLLPEIEALQKFCTGLQIRLSILPLPKELKGYNDAFQGNRRIIISEHQSLPGASTHTVLHELRELMEHVFREFGAGTAKGAELERRAELFAASVRMAEAVDGFIDVFETLEIEAAWKRCLACLAVGVFALLYIGSCAFLRCLEDSLDKQQPR